MNVEQLQRLFDTGIFIHIPRCGGKNLLETFKPGHLPKDLSRYRNYTLQELTHDQGDDIFYLKDKLFTVIRSPYARLLSIYAWVTLHRHRNQHNIPDFNVWVRNLDFIDPKSILTLNCYDWLTYKGTPVITKNRILKLEDIYPLFPILDKFKKTDKNGWGIRKDYKDMYDEETKQIVAHYFKKDLEYFDYEF